MQKGQAIIESLILLLVLATIFLAIMWLGRLQDIGLQLNHASRHNAFKLAYQKMYLSADNSAVNYLQTNKWLSRNGSSLINNASFSINITNNNPYLYTHKKFINSLELIDELNLSDKLIWQSKAIANTGNLSKGFNSLAKFDLQKLQINRFTSIMRAPNTISDDRQVQLNLANSPSAWANQANYSINLGKQVSSRLQGIDQAWARDLPKWDWLGSWLSKLPKRHLNQGGVL